MLVETTFRVRGRSSGIELENRGWQVWTVRDNLAVRVELYDEEAQALAAAGLAGDEIAEALNSKGVPPAHGTNRWTAAMVRKAYVS